MAKTKPAKPKPASSKPAKSEVTITLTGAAALADKVTIKRSIANTTYSGNSRLRKTQTESMSMIKNADKTTSTRVRKTESMTITNGVTKPPKGGKRTAATPGKTAKITATASNRGGASKAIDFKKPAPASRAIQTARKSTSGGVSKPSQPRKTSQAVSRAYHGGYNNNNTSNYYNNCSTVVGYPCTHSEYGRNNQADTYGGYDSYENAEDNDNWMSVEENEPRIEELSSDEGGYTDQEYY